MNRTQQLPAAKYVHLDWLPVGVCLVSHELCILGWNRVLEEWTGKKREAVIGRQLSEVFPDLQRSRIQCRLQQAIASRSPVVLSAAMHQTFFPALAADGMEMIQKTTIRPCEDASNELAIVVEDVSVAFRQLARLRFKKEQLKESISRLEQAERERIVAQELRDAAAECAGIGFWDWDIEQDRIMWDDTMFRTYAIEKQRSVRFKDWQKRVHPDDLSRTEWELHSALDGTTPFDSIFRIRRDNGEIRHIHGVGHIVRDQEGKPVRMVGANVDVTSQVQNEARIRASRDEARQALAEVAEAREKLEQHAALLARQNCELAAAHEKAEAATRSKSEFLANISHEIRTPMTAIQGYADLLLNDERVLDNKTQRTQALETIQRNGQHLLEIINDLLDLSKIEANRMTVERVECSPWEVVKDVIQLMRVRAEAKGLALQMRVDSALPDIVLSDPTRLRQILLNLVGNAIKFTEQGCVTIVARCVADQAVSKLEFDVLDTGIGMSEEQIARLFRPFSQADATVVRRFGGTGLGLTISRRFARMLGGDIEVTSEFRQGSCFRASIATGDLTGRSFVYPNVERKVMDPKVAPPAGLPRLECRLLLAEDGPDNQRLISFVLRKAGAEVTLAENGRIACDLALAAAAQGQPYDLIVMDMQMPEMDGYTATKFLREQGLKQPIVALTAHAMQGDREKCIAAGCTDFETKPIVRERLLQTLSDLLKSPVTSATTQR